MTRRLVFTFNLHNCPFDKLEKKEEKKKKKKKKNKGQKIGQLVWLVQFARLVWLV